MYWYPLFSPLSTHYLFIDHEATAPKRESDVWAILGFLPVTVLLDSNLRKASSLGEKTKWFLHVRVVWTSAK